MKNNSLKIRVLAIIISATVLVLVAAAAAYNDSYATSPATQVIIGDVNNDGGTNVSDAQKLISELTRANADLDVKAADLTNDRRITLADAIALIRKIMFGYKRSDLSGTAVGATVSSVASTDESVYTSVNGIALHGGTVFVSDGTGNRIYKLSANGAIDKTYSTASSVNSLFSDGKNIYSLEGGLGGKVVKLDGSLNALASCEVGHTPSDMAVIGNKGYVVNRFSNTVSVISLDSMSLVKTIEIDGREPIAAVSVKNKVYVACHLPDEAATESVISANVAVISGDTDTVSATIPLVNGASGVKDICVSPDQNTVYVSHIIGRYAYPTTQLDRGWINTNGFSVIDTASDSVRFACLLDEVDEGAANPWGITVSKDGKFLCVALSGLDEVMLIDLAKMQIAVNKVSSKRDTRIGSLDEIVNYLPFLDGCRERVKVGKGVRAIAEENGVLYCGLYFDGAIDKVHLDNRSVSRVAFKTQPKANAVRTGQILWSDANNCYQRWQSCNSCHPDAIVDGFNWDNLNDGLGNGKSAKSMLYSHRTPPVMITGIRASAEVAVAAGMKFIQFNTMSATELAYIDEYLKSLSPIESPALNKNGTLTESAKSGEALFEKNCASCHPAPLYTDLKKHNVGTAKLSGEDGSYDTPTLVEVWRTAPYMHDGSVNTIEEAVKIFAKQLSSSEVTAVADYVRSIGNAGEYYGVEQVKGKKNGAESYNVYIDGMSLTSMTVRCQHKTDSTDVVVALSVFDKNSKQVYYCDVNLPKMNVGSSALVTFGSKITLPSGGYYTVTFHDGVNGNALSSVLKIK